MTRTPPSSAVERSAYAQGYERLRRHAVRPGTGHDRRGLGVVVRHGVAAWLRAFAELPATASPPQPDVPDATLPDGLQGPAVDILVEMVRGRMAGGSA